MLQIGIHLLSRKDDEIKMFTAERYLTALLGITGQFYSVVLVGIVNSKFVSKGVDDYKK